jgi:hypothetical protein
MCATAAWQAAFGVTEFALYYNRSQRSPADYRSYCTFVGRLNALLREAQLAPRVLLYYPVADIWADYRPVAQKLVLSSQPKSLQETVNAFMGLGQRLTRAQISFMLADHEVLSAASVQEGNLCIAGRPFTMLVLPCGVELPAPAQEKVEDFQAAGGSVLHDVTAQELDVQALARTYDCGLPRDPNERLVVGRFVREGRKVVLVVNSGTTRYDGRLTACNPGSWYVADPRTGSMEPARVTSAGGVAVSLPPCGARILIGPAPAHADGISH